MPDDKNMARLADYFAVIGLDNELKPLQRDLAGKFSWFSFFYKYRKNILNKLLTFFFRVKYL